MPSFDPSREWDRHCDQEERAILEEIAWWRAHRDNVIQVMCAMIQSGNRGTYMELLKSAGDLVGMVVNKGTDENGAWDDPPARRADDQGRSLKIGLGLKRLEQLVGDVSDAAFACGEHRRSDADEPYDAVYQRSEAARRALIANVLEASREDGTTNTVGDLFEQTTANAEAILTLANDLARFKRQVNNSVAQ